MWTHEHTQLDVPCCVTHIRMLNLFHPCWKYVCARLPQNNDCYTPTLKNVFIIFRASPIIWKWPWINTKLQTQRYDVRSHMFYHGWSHENCINIVPAIPIEIITVVKTTKQCVRSYRDSYQTRTLSSPSIVGTREIQRALSNIALTIPNLCDQP